MSIILVEDRKDPSSRLALQAIADTCRQMGHEVFRWRSPHSGRVPQWRHIFHCDLAVLFNGTHLCYEKPLERLRRMGAKLLYVELGWNPQQRTCQVDPRGINFQASWASEPLLEVGRTPVAVRPQGDLLAVLQLDMDTQITQLSPWFPTMRHFLEFLCRHSQLPIRVRAHPKAKDIAAIRELATRLGAKWDESRTLAHALVDCRAAACVNSSCGVEILGHHLPLLCYGQAIYRHAGAVYCLDNRPAGTVAATEELAAGRCTLMSERVDAAYRRVMNHQWSLAEIPHRFPDVLRQVLPDADRPSRDARHRSSFPLRLWRDLPSLVLPRPKAA